MKSIKGDSGFAAISLLSILPLLLAGAAVVSSAYLVMRSDSATRHVCRLSLLNGQEKVAEKLRELVTLNKEAKALRKKRSRAEKALRSAPSPDLKALAALNLAIVIAEQQRLALEQRRLILAGQTLSRTEPAKAAGFVERALFNLQSSQAEDRLRLLFKSRVTPGRFDVVATPINSITPDYNPSINFQS